MSIEGFDLDRWNRLSLGFGATAWVLMVLLSISGWAAAGDLELILLLAFCVITPLALPLATLPKGRQWLHTLRRWLILLQPVAAICGGVSFLLDTGLLAGTTAAVWLLFTTLIALLGLARLRALSHFSLADVCLSTALLYLPIGGSWLVLARLGLQPLGFGQHTDLLTAVHFHYIPLAALLITSLLGRAVQATHRRVPQTVYRVAAMGMIVNPLLVAAGITLNQLTGQDVLESAAASLLSLSLILIALLSLRFVIPTTMSLLAKALLLVSSTAVCFTMLAAGAYALGAATGVWTITISQMIAIHGWINALIFGLCGLLGWRIKLKQG